MGKASRRKRTRRMAMPPLQGPVVLHNPKVSECLVELIRPYMRDGMSRRDYEALVGLGALAWNLTLLPAEDRERELQSAGPKLNAGPDRQGELAEVIEALQRRKGLLFPSDNRVVLEWEVQDRGCGHYLVLAASLSDGEPGQKRDRP